MVSDFDNTHTVENQEAREYPMDKIHYMTPEGGEHLCFGRISSDS